MKKNIIKYILLAVIAAALGLPIEYFLIEEAVTHAVQGELTTQSE